jgi:hypothetical protein
MIDFQAAASDGGRFVLKTVIAREYLARLKRADHRR